MNLNIIAPINQLGYGNVGTNITLALREKAKVALFPIGNQISCEYKYTENLNECTNNAAYFDVNASCIRIWHQHDMSMFVGKGQHIGFPIFELDRFSTLEKHHLLSCDKLYVCSQWAKSIINAELPNLPVTVIPLGVDTTTFFASQIPKRRKTIFINIGKWEVRKGHDLLPIIFNKAFDEWDDVELWMLNDNPFNTDEENKKWVKLYKNTKLGSKIKILPRLPYNTDVSYLIRSADCGIFPTRAEGWNLEALEVMSCGRMVITTNYSGHTEYCNHNNSILIDPYGLCPAEDGKWFFGTGHWANIDDKVIDNFVDAMRYVHNNKQLNTNGVLTGKKFTWDNSANLIIGDLHV